MCQGSVHVSGSSFNCSLLISWTGQEMMYGLLVQANSFTLNLVCVSKLQAFHRPFLGSVKSAVQVKCPAELCLLALHPWLLISLFSSLTGFLIKLLNRKHLSLSVCVTKKGVVVRKQLKRTLPLQTKLENA